MADPRKDVDFEGVGDNTATFKYDGSIVFDFTKQGGAVQFGKAVSMKGNRTVGLALDGDRIKGKLGIVEQDGHCAVQYTGGTTLPKGNGATVTNGSRIVGALDAAGAGGCIRNAVVGTALADGEDSKAAHEVLDASPTSAIKVMLQG